MKELTYAIGDVHGHSGQLRRLLERIEADARGAPYDLVFVGDYIDKGPDTAGVLARLMKLRLSAGKIVFLKGNHEADLLAALHDEPARAKWLAMGGAHVLEEYGVGSPDRLPKEVLGWIANLPTFHEDELRHFVHAGLEPTRDRYDQTDLARLTMRGDFLAHDHDFGRHIVHGHTPQLSGRPELRLFRTNLDTGVAVTGVLTAGVFLESAPDPTRILSVAG